MRAGEFINEAYVSKNAYYGVDRSINPATGKPYIQFGPNGPIDPSNWKDEQDRYNDLKNYPYPTAGVFPSYKVAMRTYKGFDKDKFKIVRAGVSKFKIVPRSDPAPELFGEESTQAHDVALDEITRMPQGDFPGGKSALHRSEPQEPRNAKPLPGGSRFVYSVDRYNEIIDIYDPTSDEPWQSRAQLIVSPANIADIDNAVKVEHITVDEDYRGEGLARSLYGIVLSVLKLPLVAGDTQTPSGRKMWQMLHNMPGVQVQGLMALPNSDLDTDAVKKLISQPGIDYLSRGNYYTFLTFPVGAGRRELRSLVKGIPLYHGDVDVDYITLMMATWHGK